MSWTARKQGPEGPTPASHGHSSTFVRVCQAPVFDSVAGSHGTRLLGAAWLPWRVFLRSVGAPAPTLDHLRTAPSYRARAEPKGEDNTEPAPHQPRAPPPPAGGRGRGGKGERLTGQGRNRTGHGAGGRGFIVVPSSLSPGPPARARGRGKEGSRSPVPRHGTRDEGEARQTGAEPLHPRGTSCEARFRKRRTGTQKDMEPGNERSART